MICIHPNSHLYVQVIHLLWQFPHDLLLAWSQGKRASADILYSTLRQYSQNSWHSNFLCVILNHFNRRSMLIQIKSWNHDEIIINSHWTLEYKWLCHAIILMQRLRDMKRQCADFVKVHFIVWHITPLWHWTISNPAPFPKYTLVYEPVHIVCKIKTNF